MARRGDRLLLRRVAARACTRGEAVADGLEGGREDLRSGGEREEPGDGPGPAAGPGRAQETGKWHDHHPRDPATVQSLDRALGQGRPGAARRTGVAGPGNAAPPVDRWSSTR